LAKRKVRCLVENVHDGDTITVSYPTSKKKFNVRLWGIDAPEANQSFGPQSKEFLVNLIKGKFVKIIFLGTDQYGRKIGKVFIDDKYVNFESVKNGMSWWYDNYAIEDTDLKIEETNARNTRIGLWGEDSPKPPWKWRAMIKINQLQVQLSKPEPVRAMKCPGFRDMDVEDIDETLLDN
jgi:micrococcal nuclease